MFVMDNYKQNHEDVKSLVCSLGPTTIPVIADKVEWKWTLVITQIIIPSFMSWRSSWEYNKLGCAHHKGK